MAVRRRTPAPVAAPPDEVPPALRAGVVVELWQRPGEGEFECIRRYRHAVTEWLAEHGIDQWDHRRIQALGLGSCRRRSWPWSYAQARLDGTLPGILATLGLPPDWTPAGEQPQDVGVHSPSPPRPGAFRLQDL